MVHRVRVPAFVHSPAHIPSGLRGSSFDDLFHVSDWLPTIVFGMAGLCSSDAGADVRQRCGDDKLRDLVSQSVS